jgi:hypothetical protein
MLVSLPTLTSLATTPKMNSTLCSFLWTDVTAVLTTMLSSRSALLFNTKLKAFSNGRKLVVTTAATTLTTGTTAEKSAPQTWVLDAA